MGARSGRNLGALLAAGLALGSAVVLTSSSASGNVPPEADPTDYDATVTIDLIGRDGDVVLDDKVDDSNDATEKIVTRQPCAAITPGSGNLLRFIANGGTNTADTVQIDNSAIGILTGNTACGTSNAGTINRSESLTIELGPYFDTLGVAAESITLNFARFQRGDLKVGFDGATPTLVPGITSYPGTVTLDNGGVLFSSITVTSTATNNAGVSLADLTSFQLTSQFEAAVDCGEQVTETGTINAVFVRGANDPTAQALKDNPGPCSDVGVIVENEIDEDGGPRLYWDNGELSVVDGTDQAVAAKITIQWQPVPVSSAGLPTLIDYDAAGTEFGYQDSQYCLSFDEQTIDVGEPPDTETQPLYIVDFPPNVGGHPDDVPWCTVLRTDDITADGMVQITEVKVGRGDPWGKVSLR